MTETEPKDQQQPWWKELPADEVMQVIVMGKVDHQNLPTDIVKRRNEAQMRHSKAVNDLLDFMEDNPDKFTDLSTKDIVASYYLGTLIISLKPAQCDSLMDSGLVERIVQDFGLELL